MLVLTRREGESIIIGSGIEVKILGVEGGSVKLGIEAPRATPVHRLEIFRAIKEENRAASRQADAVAAVLDKYREKAITK
jgi:carbon storage regulator